MTDVGFPPSPRVQQELLQARKNGSLIQEASTRRSKVKVRVKGMTGDA